LDATVRRAEKKKQSVKYDNSSGLYHQFIAEKYAAIKSQPKDAYDAPYSCKFEAVESELMATRKIMNSNWERDNLNIREKELSIKVSKWKILEKVLPEFLRRLLGLTG